MQEYWRDGKKVRAAKVKSMWGSADAGTVEVGGAYIGWFKPEPGGYYVYDDGDFYVAALPPDDSVRDEQSDASLKPCLYSVQFVKM